MLLQGGQAAKMAQVASPMLLFVVDWTLNIQNRVQNIQNLWWWGRNSKSVTLSFGSNLYTSRNCLNTEGSETSRKQGGAESVSGGNPTTLFGPVHVFFVFQWMLSNSYREFPETHLLISPALVSFPSVFQIALEHFIRLCSGNSSGVKNTFAERQNWIAKAVQRISPMARPAHCFLLFLERGTRQNIIDVGYLGIFTLLNVRAFLYTRLPVESSIRSISSLNTLQGKISKRCIR